MDALLKSLAQDVKIAKKALDTFRINNDITGEFAALNELSHCAIAMSDRISRLDKEQEDT